MENNLVELKYDKVIEFFEKFKQKYKEEYKNNNVKRTYVGHNYTSLIIGLFMALVPIGLALFMDDIMSAIRNSISTATGTTVQVDSSARVAPHISDKLIHTWILPVILIIGMAYLLKGVIDFMKGGYEVEVTYTEKEYYAKIKPKMLDELRYKLYSSITDNMLIFDSNGLIIAPNLSTNGNKKIFGEIERELKMSGKQFSKS